MAGSFSSSLYLKSSKSHDDSSIIQLYLLRNIKFVFSVHFCCCCSVGKSCPALCDPTDCNMPDSSVLQYLPEFAQVHVHWVSDAIQPSHPLLPPSPFAFEFSQHQGLFQWVGFSHQVAKALELQCQSFQWIFRVGFPSDGLVWSPCCPRESQESSPEPQLS